MIVPGMAWPLLTPSHPEDDRMNVNKAACRGQLARGGALASITAAMALAIAACSGGPLAPGGSRAYQKAVAYAQCMRSSGEPGFPDPSSTGTFSLGQIDINSLAYQTATQACQNLLPNTAQFQLSGAQKQAILTMALKHAECMRAHGISDFPDPGPNSIVVSGSGVGILLNGTAPGALHAALESPQGQAARQACMSFSPFADHGRPPQ
jgi:hypothetical protein